MKRVVVGILVGMFFLAGAFASAGASDLGRVPAAFAVDGKYDYSMALYAGGIEEIASDWPRIYASGIPMIGDGNGGEKPFGEEPTVQSGRVIIIPPYVIALDHIVTISDVAMPIMTPFGVQAMKIPVTRVGNEEFWLQSAKNSAAKILLKKLLVIPNMDLAFFEMPAGAHVRHAAFTIGNSYELQLLHSVIVLGSPSFYGVNVRVGAVSALYSDFDQDRVSENAKKDGTFVQGEMGISVPIVPGDSGSPVVAFRDGRPELVGIVNTQLLGILGTMIPIDEVLRHFKEATGVDLREVSRKDPYRQ